MLSLHERRAASLIAGLYATGRTPELLVALNDQLVALSGGQWLAGCQLSSEQWHQAQRNELDVRSVTHDGARLINPLMIATCLPCAPGSDEPHEDRVPEDTQGWFLRARQGLHDSPSLRPGQVAQMYPGAFAYRVDAAQWQAAAPSVLTSLGLRRRESVPAGLVCGAGALAAGIAGFSEPGWWLACAVLGVVSYQGLAWQTTETPLNKRERQEATLDALRWADTLVSAPSSGALAIAPGPLGAVRLALRGAPLSELSGGRALTQGTLAQGTLAALPSSAQEASPQEAVHHPTGAQQEALTQGYPPLLAAAYQGLDAELRALQETQRRGRLSGPGVSEAAAQRILSWHAELLSQAQATAELDLRAGTLDLDAALRDTEALRGRLRRELRINPPTQALRSYLQEGTDQIIGNDPEQAEQTEYAAQRQP